MKRLQKRKKKEKLQNRMKIAAIISVIAMVCIFAITAAQYIPKSRDTTERMGRGPPGGRSFNLEEWDVIGNVTIPQGEPNFAGMVIEERGERSFVLQPMRRDSEDSEEEVTFAQDVNIFRIDREGQTLIEATYDEIKIDSMIMVWGEQQSDGIWLASDIGLMTGR